MDEAFTKDASLELEPEENHRPFSVVLAPAALVAVQNQQHGGCNALIRHLPVPQHRSSNNSSNSSTEGGRPRKQSPARRPSPLSGVVVAVRAQPHVLHLFRGRRLCRVVEFSSPISDFAGFPPGCAPCFSRLDLLCVAVCRDGTAYAVPIAEVLDAERGDNHRDNAGVAAGSVGVSSSAAGGDGAHAETTAATRKQRAARPSASASLGIFEDLAPTILSRDPSSPPQQQAPHQQQRGKGSSSNCSGVSGGSVGGLVLRVQEQWAVFSHLGARTIVACGGLTAASAVVAGIIDRAAVYGLAGREGERGTPAAGRCLASLDGVDGAAPTTSCMIWAEDGRGASGDGKGFSLPSRVFRALFGDELAFSQSASSSSSSSPPPPPPPPLPRDNDSTGGSHGVTSSEPPLQPAVILLGDSAGTVRWAPAYPHRGASGGILASLTASIVGVYPQLNAASRAIGVLVVGADGAVLSLTAESARPPRAAPRKRARRDAAGESGRRGRGGSDGGAGASLEDSCRGSADTNEPPPSVCRRALRLPFPVASACSTPGFLVHCHAGALFASAVPKEDTDRGGRQGSALGDGSLDRPSPPPAPNRPRGPREGPSGRPEPPGFSHDARSAHAVPLRPVRLPLPCDAVGVSVAVLAEDEVDADAAADLSSATLRTLVVSLSAQGRVVGFVAPRSVEELEGWALDTGRGGVRVGGTAGVENRVRCQLEKLSSLGRQCAALSAESAERDREIRTLRGATEIFPPLVRSSTRRRRGGASQDLREASPPLEHSVAMTPDAAEAASSEDWCGGGGGSDGIRVRLCVRLQWPAQGSCSRSLPAAGKEGAGRWFVVTRIVADGDGGGRGNAVGERWAWSTSTLLPMASLRQGRPWSSSVALSLPSARPVTTTSWLQFSFAAEGSSGCDGGRGGGPLDKAAGACVELGSSHFDLLDWGVRLSSVPGSAVAVRRAARGRGACFCGPDLTIAEICGTVPSTNDGGGGASRASEGSLSAWKNVLATWRSFELRVTSSGCDAGALLGLLVPSSAHPPAAASGSNVAPASGAAPELAVRVAGQVAVIRARDYGAGAKVGVVGGAGAARGTGGQTGSRTIEISVTCSHEAMSPLVREALVRRASALAALSESGGGEGVGGGGGGGKANAGTGEVFCGDLLARGDAAARLVREVHPIGRAIGDLGDAARVLGAVRASDGPSVESAKEALSLMHRVGEVYQALRHQQEGASVVV